jgi:hypothetical protein
MSLKEQRSSAAIKKAIRETEEERTRQPYLAQPDSEAEADDWSSAEEWKSAPAPAPCCSKATDQWCRQGQ